MRHVFWRNPGEVRLLSRLIQFHNINPFKQQKSYAKEQKDRKRHHWPSYHRRTQRRNRHRNAPQQGWWVRKETRSVQQVGSTAHQSRNRRVLSWTGKSDRFLGSSGVHHQSEEHPSSAHFRQYRWIQCLRWRLDEIRWRTHQS